MTQIYDNKKTRACTWFEEVSGPPEEVRGIQPARAKQTFSFHYKRGIYFSQVFILKFPPNPPDNPPDVFGTVLLQPEFSSLMPSCRDGVGGGSEYITLHNIIGWEIEVSAENVRFKVGFVSIM